MGMKFSLWVVPDQQRNSGIAAAEKKDFSGKRQMSKAEPCRIWMCDFCSAFPERRLLILLSDYTVKVIGGYMAC
jgi:hypothetical protein